ncbi:integral membrane protein duf6 [Diplodia corticola]|uniref:Integral membrane protein duf6 n=1 Tax=Diplodia corticola TaxID=236234 RepID=A0A1J9RLY6_9PEZI|nr:integral membrane protein duf6 [Diplodia corticola]OJD33587.1 integral membrane protein duf6 [Diplodia corticola]
MSPLPNATNEGKKPRSASDAATFAAVVENDALARVPVTKPSGQSLRLSIPRTPDCRAASPAPSALSMDDYPSAHTATSSTFLLPRSFRDDELSEKRPQTWRTRLQALWSHNKGLILVLISQLFGVAMNIATRILEIEGNDGNGYNPFQILFARMGITLILSSLYVWWTKVEHAPFGPREVRWLLVLRGFGGFFGVFGVYYSLLYLPLSDATVITFLAPSLACFACSILINEPFTRTEQTGALISLLGVVLIARPASLFTFSSPSPPSSATPSTTSTSPSAGDYTSVTPSQRATAVAVALVGVLGAATAFTTLRWIGRRAHALISVNYFAAWCTFVSFVAMLVSPSIPFLLPTSSSDWALLVFLGVCGFVMQFLLAAGLQHERSGRATNMVYCQMLFALAGDRVVFGTGPDGWGWAGSGLILGSAVVVAVRKREGGRGGGLGVRAGGLGDEERGLGLGLGDGDGDVGGFEEEGGVVRGGGHGGRDEAEEEEVRK